MNLNKETHFNDSRLGTLSPGTSAEIIGFCLSESEPLDEASEWRRRFLHRLHEVGFLVGEKLEILNEAPLSGDPISIRIKNGVYALRRDDANLIYVKQISS